MVAEAFRYFSGLARSGLAPFLRQLLGDVTLADVLARWARKRPDALALDFDGERFSYRELQQVAQAAAGELRRSGLRAGDVVALVGRNSVGYVALLLGGAQSGITLALVHPELTGDPLRHALVTAGAKHVLCERALLDAVSPASDVPVTAFDPETRAPFASELVDVAFAAERGQHDLALVYTSGTTGLPKACRVPHSRVLAAACLFGAPLYDFRRGDKLLCALPLYHGSPLMLGLGACLVTATPLLLKRRFSASELLASARSSGATALLYVGDLGRMLLATPPSARDREHTLRLAVGNGMSPDVWGKFQGRFGIAQVREFYAATESPVGIFNLSGRVGAVGNLPYAWMFGLKLARIDPHTGELLRDARGRLQECAADEPGELLVRAGKSGLGVYHGYVDGEATEARLVRSAFSEGDALFRTGDLLRRDRDGFYYFVERRGDTYRFRGENVSVVQVERELLKVPGVQAALVTGVAVAGEDGRVGLAALVTDVGFDVASLAELGQRLPRAALPRIVRLVPELPRTASLKLKRRELAEQGFDPARVSGQLWLLVAGVPRRLDPDLYRDISNQRVRL